MNFSTHQYLRYELLHLFVREVVFEIRIEKRKPLVASGGRMALYRVKQKGALKGSDIGLPTCKVSDLRLL